MVHEVFAPLPEMVTVPNAPPQPLPPPAPLSEDWRVVWGALLPWKYPYGEYRTTTARKMPPEVVSLKQGWQTRGTFQSFEVWDSIVDPILVGVNAKKPLENGGLRGAIINHFDAVLRLFGIRSRFEYTLLARWAEVATDMIGDKDILGIVSENATFAVKKAGNRATFAVQFTILVLWFAITGGIEVRGVNLQPPLFSILIATLGIVAIATIHLVARGAHTAKAASGRLLATEFCN